MGEFVRDQVDRVLPLPRIRNLEVLFRPLVRVVGSREGRGGDVLHPSVDEILDGSLRVLWVRVIDSRQFPKDFHHLRRLSEVSGNVVPLPFWKIVLETYAVHLLLLDSELSDDERVEVAGVRRLLLPVVSHLVSILRDGEQLSVRDSEEPFLYCNEHLAGALVVRRVVAGEPVTRELRLRLRPSLNLLVGVGLVRLNEVRPLNRRGRVRDEYLVYPPAQGRVGDDDQLLVVVLVPALSSVQCNHRDMHRPRVEFDSRKGPQGNDPKGGSALETLPLQVHLDFQLEVLRMEGLAPGEVGPRLGEVE